MQYALPPWWIALSALFLVVNIVFFGILIYVLFKILGIAKGLEPRMAMVSARIDSIGAKIDDLTLTLKEMAAKVSARADNVGGSVQAIGNVAATQVEKYGPVIAAATTVYKVVGALRQLVFFRGKRR